MWSIRENIQELKSELVIYKQVFDSAKWSSKNSSGPEIPGFRHILKNYDYHCIEN